MAPAMLHVSLQNGNKGRSDGSVQTGGGFHTAKRPPSRRLRQLMDVGVREERRVELGEEK